MAAEQNNYFELEEIINDDIKIYLQGWTPVKSETVICIVHGLGEHSGRYEELANYFNNYGYSVLAVDLYGHGRSDGKRGHIPDYNMLMQNVSLLLENAHKRFPELPCILYGHSLGGNIVLNYVLRYKHNLKGLIVSAPWLKLYKEPPVFKKIMGKVINYIYPVFTQTNGIDPEQLSQDKKIIQEYKEDPYVHDRISSRLYVEASRAGDWAIENVTDFSFPVLLMHGTYDSITSFEASLKFTDNTNCYFKKWQGLYHELHNEPGRREVYEYLLNWIVSIS